MNAPLRHPPVLERRPDMLASAQTWLVPQADQDEPIGRQARRLFRALRLYDRPRHPRARLLHVPVLRQIALAIHALYCLCRVGGAVKARFGKSHWRQLLEITDFAFRDGFDAQTYYMQELYAEQGVRRATQTLTRFETKNGLLSALKRLAPRRAAGRSPLGDKLAFHARCRRHGVATVPILLSATRGQCEMLDGIVPGIDLFMKPRHGKGARGAGLLRHLGDNHYRSDDGGIFSTEAMLADLARRSLETPYLLQPRLTNHRDIADLA
ncbi:MAG: hypothetical protein IPK59_17450 [Rhodospirillaceae bacterium]|nr:hypothetical protein [Rhodospirillaceae bacterium]